jgi:hypothetical protein
MMSTGGGLFFGFLVFLIVVAGFGFLVNGSMESQQEMEAMTTALEAANSKIAQLEAELQARDQIILDLETQVKQLELEKQSLTIELQTAAANIAELQRQNEQLHGQVSSLTKVTEDWEPLAQEVRAAVTNTKQIILVQQQLDRQLMQVILDASSTLAVAPAVPGGQVEAGQSGSPLLLQVALLIIAVTAGFGVFKLSVRQPRPLKRSFASESDWQSQPVSRNHTIRVNVTPEELELLIRHRRARKNQM